MSNFDVLILNIYLLAIFSILVKSKTNPKLYRLFKLLDVALFGYLVSMFFTEKLVVIDTIVKVFPLVLLIITITQTETTILLRKLGINKNRLFQNTIEDQIKIEIIKSVDYLAGRQIGAIITFEKGINLEEYIQGAFQVNAPINSELLSTIFYPNTPLHDGAVIVRKNQIVCAGAYYPPSDRLDIPKELGSRHRAAIGISEITDALTIVVSEQTGKISVAIDGYLDQDITKEALILYIEKHLQE
ncbi:DNA integrity scanning protein DisA nucleotide-binding domain protein [Candidatus Izimaplasma sp. ZiA1]|uniref:diadenylate cyclase n=1 Tax=Candidatus Izimoplasma sp. ZiA1 TaxID=2024899 RepID=UPI001439217B